MKKLFNLLAITSAVLALTAGYIIFSAYSELGQARGKATAIHNASAAFQGFVKDVDSQQAERDKGSIVDALHADGLKLEDVPIEQSYLDRHLHDLYLSDAAATYEKLRGTHHNIQRATDLRSQYEDYMEKARMSISPAMEKQLALNIARNEVEQGHAVQRAHGVNPNPPVKKPVRKAPARKTSAMHK